ncbi:MAG: tetratricopeptide repeat protein [Xanthomonadales bacterium]|nr:tetratricopeptide repeat protein [Xanthomonadales bacterium]
MTLFAELKRRNVFKVGIAYLVMAWLVMQVADVILNNVAAPGWIFHVILLLLGIGFVLALFFAWEFELTPEGLKKEKDVDRSQSITHVTSQKLNYLIIGMLVLALGYFAFDKFVLSGARDAALVEATTQALTEQAAEAPVDESPSIAVLPFVNMSSDEEQEYFSDGLSEELLNLLARIPDLRVTSRSSAFYYKGKDIKIAEVGRELNVANVLEGSVRKSGNQIRVTAQLIRVSDDVHLWSESYDRSLDDIFAIQDEIAAHVVEQLKVELLGEAPQATETDPEAYALFLQGRAASRLHSEQSYENAIEFLKASLAIDPDYAPSWANLSSVYVNQVSRGIRSFEEGYDLAFEATQRALAADPVHAPAIAQLGWITAYHDHDLAAAAKHYERALALEPGNLPVLANASGLAMDLGRLDQAIAMMEFVVARDPVYSSGHHNLAYTYFLGGQYADTVESARRALQLSPGRSGSSVLMGLAQLMMGDAEAALHSMQVEPNDLYRHFGLALSWFALGNTQKADKALATFVEQYGSGSPELVAHVHAFRNEPNAAFEWIEKAIGHYGGFGPEIYTDPVFRVLHGDPRWSALREREGVSQSLLDSIEFNVRLPNERQLAEAAD